MEINGPIMNKLIAAFLGFSLVIFAGCASLSSKAEFAPPRGIFFTSYKAPLLIDYNETPVEDQKGSASAQFFWDPILTGASLSWNDCSIKKASGNGQITKVGTADYEFFSILGIYAKTTVHVYSAP